jgi:N-acetylglucosaminyldiphosphoundecaprenol N-acetyl-beta-D-mannosaminyltransferase
MLTLQPSPQRGFGHPGDRGENRPAPFPEEPVPPEPVWIWGLPFAPFTFRQTLEHVEALIRRNRPSYFATVNLHTTMLARQDAGARSALLGTAFIVADGMPLVWASRWRLRRLPERVAGSDLLPALCELAARKGYRVFLLGGAPGVAEQAAEQMCRRHPGLQVVGIEAPPFRPLSPGEQAALVARIRAARPHMLFVAFGQPKGEVWLRDHCETVGVPVCVQVGATLDFMAGRFRRAPRWLQRTGLEWAYRLYQEPGRLFMRYARNAAFLLRMFVRDAGALLRGGGREKVLRGKRA